MTIPDKLEYTKAEKAGEIACGIFAVAFTAAEITMMVLGITDGGNIILLVVMLIIYGMFSLCGVYPQHTNLFNKPEKVSEENFHKVRSGCIIGKAVVMIALFLLSLPFGK